MLLPSALSGEPYLDKGSPLKLKDLIDKPKTGPNME